jgi:hypothetical protein
MLMNLRDSAPGPCAGTSDPQMASDLQMASDPQMDCVLGPSRARTDPVDQWENEGGRVQCENAGRRRERHRRKEVAAAGRPPSLARSAMMGAITGSADLHACGRCHGPIRLARASLLGRFLGYWIAIEQYHCADPTCGWSGLRRNPGATIRSPLSGA